MGYELFGRLHAALSSERGQGTIEYVGLVLLMAVVLAAVVSFTGAKDQGGQIANTIITKLKDSIEGLGGDK